jgi:hypothetical protein
LPEIPEVDEEPGITAIGKNEVLAAREDMALLPLLSISWYDAIFVVSVFGSTKYCVTKAAASVLVEAATIKSVYCWGMLLNVNAPAVLVVNVFV